MVAISKTTIAIIGIAFMAANLPLGSASPVWPAWFKFQKTNKNPISAIVKPVFDTVNPGLIVQANKQPIINQSVRPANSQSGLVMSNQVPSLNSGKSSNSLNNNQVSNLNAAQPANTQFKENEPIVRKEGYKPQTTFQL
ncbi:hypothetical protein BDF19DRAFT_433405 [Syncephalis fuscata]|nr:hypothetical protein BDF19DRAFT_433405 [Syncephalis fuscata]